MSNYDPLLGKMKGDPKHYPEHSKPERFKETRFSCLKFELSSFRASHLG